MSKKKIIPFGWLPGHIGLAGKTREIAKAEYELSGYELEERLLTLKYDDDDQNKELQRKLLDIQLKYKKISEDVYHRNLAALIEDPIKQALTILELDYKANKIGQLEYDKQVASLKGEPWVVVLNMDVNSKSSLEGSFELDWNEHFVQKLKAEGYTGPTNENIVNQWFMTLCKNIALEEFDGTGDFTPDAEANLESFKQWSAEQQIQGRKIHK